MTRGMSVMWLRSYTLSAREEIVWVPLVFDSQETLVITSPEFLLPMHHVLACLVRVLAVTEGAELFAHYGPSFRKTTIIQGTRIPAYGCWKRHQCCPESRMDGCIVSSNLHHFTLKKKQNKIQSRLNQRFYKTNFYTYKDTASFRPLFKICPRRRGGYDCIKILTFVINKGNTISKSFGKSEIVLCAFPIIFQKFSIDV